MVPEFYTGQVDIAQSWMLPGRHFAIDMGGRFCREGSSLKTTGSHSLIACLWKIPASAMDYCWSGALHANMGQEATRRCCRIVVINGIGSSDTHCTAGQSRHSWGIPGTSGIHDARWLQKNSPFGGKASGSSRLPTQIYLKCGAAASCSTQVQV